MTEATPAKSPPIRVLLVEDNPGDAELVSAALSSLGRGRFALEQTGRLKDALERIEREPPDLIALDLTLPDSSGRDTFAWVRAAVPELPIVVLTGQDDSELALDLIHEGAQDFLVKWDLSPPTILRSFGHAIERKRIEVELRRAREAALRSAQAKTAFVSSMSHEIRTPLNAILGMAELLRDTTLDDEQIEYVSIFQRCGNSLLALLNNVLELARIESDEVEIAREPFDLHEVIEDVAQTFGYPAHKKRLALVCDLRPGVPRWVVGDGGRLRQVLTNLIGNAIKFTDEGEVVVEVARDPNALHRIVFRVLDTGTGIPENRLEVVFDRFVQADQDIVRKRGGSGLGLALCKELVGRMDGTIGAERRGGKGMIFEFSLPLPPDAEPESDAEPRLRGLRLLLVLASGAERSALRRRLEAEGAAVAERDGATPALELLEQASREQARFDAVLVDARMPEVGGLEVARWLSRHEVADRVIALLPMDHRIGDRARCRSLRARPLVKPLRWEGLIEALTGDAPVVEAEPQAESASPDALSGVRILLVDDAVENRTLVLAFLKKSGCIVEVATDGAEAVEMFRSAPFDIVLMDMQMPVMDGYAATGEIRRHESERGAERTPVLALTAYAFAEEKQRCLDAGCDAHVSKPIDKRTLLATIAEHARVRTIRVEIDPELADLVPGYLENRRQGVQELRDALANGDFDTVRRLGHDLKGSGAGYGFAAISEIGAELETAGKQQEPGAARRGLDRLEDYLARVELVGGVDGGAAASSA